ncbi:MAG: hypothetical protein WBC44_07045 [Planctomycetaceae bacterium]
MLIDSDCFNQVEGRPYGSWLELLDDVARAVSEALHPTLPGLHAFGAGESLASLIADIGNAACASEPATQQPEAVGNKRRCITADEADAKAKQIAKDDPEFVKTATLADWAQEIGCHHNTAKKSGFILACIEQAKKQKATRNSGRKAVSLTDAVLANAGDDGDDELQRLIEEQGRDYDPSPVSQRGKSPRVRPTL